MFLRGLNGENEFSCTKIFSRSNLKERMQLSWSISRDQILHNCERCYYFQYLAEAKINSRDQTLREIALLKKLKNIPMWQGDAFHATIADYLRELKSGKQPSLDQLIDSLKNQMLMEWTFSANKTYILKPQGIDKAGGLALFEHEYDLPIEQEIDGIIEEVINLLCHFKAWVDGVNLANLLRSANRIWLEEPVFGPSAPVSTSTVSMC